MTDKKEINNEELEEVSGGFEWSKEKKAYLFTNGEGFISSDGNYIYVYTGPTQEVKGGYMSGADISMDSYQRQSGNTFVYKQSFTFNFEAGWFSDKQSINLSNYQLTR